MKDRDPIIPANEWLDDIYELTEEDLELVEKVLEGALLLIKKHKRFPVRTEHSVNGMVVGVGILPDEKWQQ